MCSNTGDTLNLSSILSLFSDVEHTFEGNYFFNNWATHISQVTVGLIYPPEPLISSFQQ